MAAGVFTPSNLNRAVLRLGELFKTPNHTQSETIEKAESAKALLLNHQARVTPIITDGNCTGITAYYLRGAHNVASVPTDCTTPDGVFSGTLATNYANEVLASDAQKAMNNRCENALGFVEEMAFQMQLAMASCRKQLNTLAITRTAANAMNNISTLPAAWDGTTDAPRINAPAADFKWDNLGEFQYVANNNLLNGDWFFLSGRNFYNEFFKATAYAQSPEGKAQMMGFGQFNMHWDARYLDATTTRLSTFGIQKSSYAFWNHYWGSSTPTEVTVGSNGKKMEFFLEDPELVYIKDGRAVPVIYMVEVEESCGDRNDNTQLQVQYKVWVRLVGGLKFAPSGLDSAGNTTKGVIEFSNIG